MLQLDRERFQHGKSLQPQTSDPFAFHTEPVFLEQLTWSTE